MIRTLTFSTLFPNAGQPTHGIFVENRLRHLVATGEVATQVLAPVPWFPSSAPIFGAYAQFAKTPAREVRYGLEVFHPRYIVVPKLAMYMTPWTLYCAAKSALARLLRSGFEFDLIDAHFFYPDGVVATWLGRKFGKPVVITGRGTDLNLIPQYALPRRLITQAAQSAAGIVTVCEALRGPLIELGIAPERVRVLRNGVDLDTFKPHDRATSRAVLGLTRPTALSIGHLIERKGHDIAIGAVARLPGVDLLIVGDGPEEARLKALVAKLRISDRVRFLGRRPHDELADIYSAVDVMILASGREGWANVLLEAMACGTPVVASAIWGTPEVVTSPEAGLLVEERAPEPFSVALAAVLAAPPGRAATRRYAEGFGWATTTAGQLQLFSDILSAPPHVRRRD